MGRVPGVLPHRAADVEVVGLEYNVEGEQAPAFQLKLRDLGVAFFDEPCAEQDTVADVSEKGYVLSWATGGLERGVSTFFPDLCAAVGIDRGTGFMRCRYLRGATVATFGATRERILRDVVARVKKFGKTDTRKAKVE